MRPKPPNLQLQGEEMILGRECLLGNLLRIPSVVWSFYEVGSSSTPGGSSTPPPLHDATSERQARFLAREDVDPAPRGKGISIGARTSDKEEAIIFELKEEIGILNQKLIEKDVLIGTLNIIVSELEKENI
ncbi:unnamed protein product [Lactuca saligna]|uniref:Uncharacterized protein n=1 Tax=Lactuca saligna TaxID=75948 RepID=A0AA35VLS5_LACSI|nr:unnamed protein product [Lactuca saligna]